VEGLSRRGTLAFHFPPIVITTAIDPVGAGLAESLARPGGNVTGVALLTPEISGKALSLLKEAVPTLSRVAVLWNGEGRSLRRSD
jgi:putative ABC transport system substrate-binding protein